MSRRAQVEDEGDDLEVIDLDAPGAIDRPPAFERYRIDGDGGLDDDDEPRGSWSRRRWLVVAVVVAVVAATAGAFAATRDDEQSRDVALDVPTTERGHATFTDAAAASIAVGQTVRSLLTGPIVIGGPDGARLVSPREATANLLAGTAERARVVDRNGQIVLVDDGDELSIVDLTARRPTVTRDSATVTVFPATTLNEFWIMDGRTLRAAYGAKSYRLPRGLRAVAQVNGGFLVRSTSLELAVWDPATGNTRALPVTSDDIVATRPDRVAWIGEDCGALRCPIHLTDVATGTDAVIGSPFSPAPMYRRSADAYHGRFSPDGRYLAILTPLRNSATGGVALVDIAAGTATRLAALYRGVSSSLPDQPHHALPFDWTADGTSLLALERGDATSSSRLTRIDVATGTTRVSGNALPLADTVVSVAIPAPTTASPSLPAAHPLLGAPSGATLVNVAGNVVERLDLDTGRMTTYRLGPSPDDIPGGDNTLAPSLVPMRNGAVLTNLFGSFWIPRTGAVRVLDDSGGNVVIGETRDRAWIVRVDDPGRSQDVQLIPVDGTTGGTGTPISAFAQPAGAVTRGFIDFVGPRLDRPGFVDLWDPASGAHRAIDAPIMSRDTTSVLAAGDRIVWSTECDGIQQQAQCGLHTLDVVTGEERDLGDWTTRGMSLSPDGTAVIFNPFSGEGAGSLQYVGLATGTRTQLPRASGVGTTVWGPDGWVFYDGNNVDGLAAWRPGMTEPIVLTGVSSTLETATAF